MILLANGEGAAGVATTARSTRCGSLSTDAKHGTPRTSLYFGLTANSGPLKPASSMLAISTSPTLPFLSVAPMIATDCGSNSGVR